jgi:hypothetical protein
MLQLPEVIFNEAVVALATNDIQELFSIEPQNEFVRDEFSSGLYHPLVVPQYPLKLQIWVGLEQKSEAGWLDPQAVGGHPRIA